ncbi:MAG: threonine/serine exporter [Lachnospiraceae bacterium]|nr:threonine/serine exporter [Lachnospiraceae bacterium]
MFLQILGSFLAVVSFGFLLGSPRKYIPYAGIIGALGWTAFLLLRNQGLSIGPATFISGCLISLCAQILARILKTPVTIFVITGILPLVPGAGMYHIAASVIQADPAGTSYYVLQTLTIAGMIAVSIVVVDNLFRLLPKRKKSEVSDS